MALSARIGQFKLFRLMYTLNVLLKQEGITLIAEQAQALKLLSEGRKRLCPLSSYTCHTPTETNSVTHAVSFTVFLVQLRLEA